MATQPRENPAGDRPRNASATARRRERFPRSWAFVAAFAVIGGFWAAGTRGIVCSNDGSHLALARALALRGETKIDCERSLTAGVDLARRDGHYYSDRPPGTAFLALPAVWLGARLDPRLEELARARGGPVVTPASALFSDAYERAFPDAPPLASYQGTALIVGLHCVGLGLLALLALDALLKMWKVGRAGRLFALLAVGLGSLWGPYSTALFSHGSTIACMAAFMLTAEGLRRSGQGRPGLAILSGIAGAGAIACDYTLVIVIPLAAALVVPRRHWPALLLGAAPVAAATGLYHVTAFGSLFAVGYHYHATFDFARSTQTFFGGDPWRGLWTLWGAGKRAGILAMSPVLLVGLAGLVAAGSRDRRVPGTSRPPGYGRWLLAFLPWVALLAFNQTAWGGGTRDYRYLSGLLPLLGVGLGAAWQRFASARVSVRIAFAALAAFSAYRVWDHFTSWHGAGLIASPWTGAGVALLVAAGGGVASRLKARSPAAETGAAPPSAASPAERTSTFPPDRPDDTATC